MLNTRRKKNAGESREWVEREDQCAPCEEGQCSASTEGSRLAFQMTLHAPAPQSLLSLQGLARSLINSWLPFLLFHSRLNLAPSVLSILTTRTPHAAS